MRRRLARGSRRLELRRNRLCFGWGRAAHLEPRRRGGRARLERTTGAESKRGGGPATALVPSPLCQKDAPLLFLPSSSPKAKPFTPRFGKCEFDSAATTSGEERERGKRRLAAAICFSRRLLLSDRLLSPRRPIARSGAASPCPWSGPRARSVRDAAAERERETDARPDRDRGRKKLTPLLPQNTTQPPFRLTFCTPSQARLKNPRVWTHRNHACGLRCSAGEFFVLAAKERRSLPLAAAARSLSPRRALALASPFYVRVRLRAPACSLSQAP